MVKNKTDRARHGAIRVLYQQQAGDTRSIANGITERHLFVCVKSLRLAYKQLLDVLSYRSLSSLSTPICVPALASKIWEGQQ